MSPKSCPSTAALKRLTGTIQKDFQEAFHPTVRVVNGSFDFTVFALWLVG